MKLGFHLLFASTVAWTSESFLLTSFSIDHPIQSSVAFIRPHSRVSIPLRLNRLSSITASSSGVDDDKDYMSNLSPNQQEDKDMLLLSKLERISLYGPIRLILASQSPRRREILDMMGLRGRYNVQPSPLDETALQVQLANNDDQKGLILPKRYTEILAESKARALVESGQIKFDDSDNGNGEESTRKITTFVLGSDTIVDLNGTILEKPNSKAHAVEMLHSLSGSWHEVHTAVSLYRMDYTPLIDTTNTNTSSELVTTFTDTTRVKFASIGENDIQAYVETGEPMDKSGSYGIQGIGGQFVEKIEGEFFTVMGLPMHRLSREFAKALSGTP